MDCLPPQSLTEIHQSVEDFKRCPNQVQHKGSDFANAVRVERGISFDEALAIAREDSEIAYFFYTKSDLMVLEIPAETQYDPQNDPLKLGVFVDFQGDQEGMRCGGFCRVFHFGDAVFFKNEGKWLETAPGLADVFEKQ